MTKTNFYLKHRLIFNCALLTLLFLVNCFWGGMSFVVFPLLAVMVLLDNLENGFSYILFCMPYRLINFTTSNIIYYIAIIVYIIKFCFVFFVKEKGKIEKSVLILLGVLVVYCLLPIGNYNYNLFFKLCSIIFVIGAMLLIVKKPNVFRPLFSVRLISVSLLISCLMGLTYFISPYLQTTNLMVVSSNDGSVFRYFGLFRQPNVLAMMCEIIISCLAAAIISQKCNWLDVLLFVLVAAAGVTTFSKTYIIILAVVLFALFVGLMKVNWKKTLLFSMP